LSSDVVGSEESVEMISDGSTGNEILSDGMWDLETFEDWDSVGNTIT